MHIGKMRKDKMISEFVRAYYLQTPGSPAERTRSNGLKSPSWGIVPVIAPKIAIQSTFTDSKGLGRVR
jgi:hypothetical protein